MLNSSPRFGSMLLVRACGPFLLLQQHLLAVVVFPVSSVFGSLRTPSRVDFQGVLGPLPLLGFVEGSGFVFRGEQGCEGGISVGVRG